MMMAVSKTLDRPGGNGLSLIGNPGHELETNIPIKTTIIKKRKGPNVPPKMSRVKDKDRRQSVVKEAFSKSKLDDLTVISGLTKQQSISEIAEKDPTQNDYEMYSAELLFAAEGGARVDSTDMFTIMSLGPQDDINRRGIVKIDDDDGEDCIDPALVKWNDFTDKERLEENMQSLITCKKVILELQVAKLDYIPGIIALPIFHCKRCWELWNKNKQIEDNCREESSPFRGLPMALDEVTASLLLLNNDESTNISYIQVRGRKRRGSLDYSSGQRRNTLYASFNSHSSIGLDGSSSYVGIDGRRRYGGVNQSDSSYSYGDRNAAGNFGEDGEDYGEYGLRHGDRSLTADKTSRNGTTKSGHAFNGSSNDDGFLGGGPGAGGGDGFRSFKDEVLDDMKYSRIPGEPYDEKLFAGDRRGGGSGAFGAYSAAGGAGGVMSADDPYNFKGNDVDASGRRRMSALSQLDEKGDVDGTPKFPTGARHGELPSLPSQKVHFDANGNPINDPNINRNLESINEDGGGNGGGMIQEGQSINGSENGEGGGTGNMAYQSIFGNTNVDSKLYSKVQVHGSLLSGNGTQRNSLVPGADGSLPAGASNGGKPGMPGEGVVDSSGDKDKNGDKSGHGKNKELPELNNRSTSRQNSSRMSGPTSSSNNWLTGARGDDKVNNRRGSRARPLKGEDRRNSRRESRTVPSMVNSAIETPANPGEPNSNFLLLNPGEPGYQKQQQQLQQQKLQQQKLQQQKTNGEVLPDGTNNISNSNYNRNGSPTAPRSGNRRLSANSIESFRNNNRTSERLPPIEQNKGRPGDENNTPGARANRADPRYNVANMFASQQQMPNLQNRRDSDPLRWDQQPNNQFYNTTTNSNNNNNNNPSINNSKFSNMFGTVSPDSLQLSKEMDYLRPPSIRNDYTPSPPIPSQVSTTDYVGLSLMNFTNSFTYSFYDLPVQYRNKEGMLNIANSKASRGTKTKRKK